MNFIENYKQSGGLASAIHKHNITLVKTILSNINNENLSKIWEYNNKEKELYIALTQAIKIGNCEITELLFKSGADIAYYDHDNSSLLIDSITKDNLTMVELLLKHGANHAPFKNAIVNNIIFNAKSKTMAELLIQYGANVNTIRNHEENTIAHTFWSDCVPFDLCEFLLKKEIDLRIKNRDGLTALEYCQNILFSENPKMKLMRYYDNLRKEKIIILLSAFMFDKNSLVSKEHIGKDMFLLIMSCLK